jgi:glycosyltransferase involved in cell wall biosynthesis
MKVLVNAVALASAGGRSVAMNFLKAYAVADGEDEFLVCSPPMCGYEELAGKHIRILPLSRFLTQPSLRLILGSRLWRRLVQRERPDVIFNMGNYALSVPVPQMTLFHWPYAIYPESEAWRLMGWTDWVVRKLRCLVFRRQLPFTSVMVAQTQTAAERLRRLYGIRNIRVIPNAVSLRESNGTADPLPALGPRSSPIRLLCLTRYYSHKNIEVLLPVARQFRDTNAPFRIILTFAPDQESGAKALMAGVRREGLTDYIRNVGPVGMRDVPRLYVSVDALLLPTLLESFSQTYIEAMHFGKPVFTSDRDFAREVCGDVAFYFDPQDPGDIVRTVVQAFEHRGELAARVERGRQRVAAMPDWHTVAGMFVDVLHRVGSNPHAQEIQAAAE